MAKSAGGGERLPQHPYVERLKQDPSQPAKRVVELIGLPGNSDRPGYQRLYLTTKLDYYAEFQTSDIEHAVVVPADKSPFAGHEATRVGVARDATIHYIWARSPQPVDEFDLDIRLGAPRAAAAHPGTHIGNVPGGTCDFCRTDDCPQTDGCPTNTCHTQCNQVTCHTCQTQCNQATCQATCQTCQTQCNQATCHTCQTQCNQPTCHTCQTQCNQQTCHTCQTQCNQHTCVDTLCGGGTCHTCITCAPPGHCHPP
jgi:hypothetical protein